MISIKRLIASLLISLSIISNMTLAVTAEEIVSPLDTEIGISNTEVVKNIYGHVDDLNVQLNDLYRLVGEELNIDYIYVKMIHMIAGGKAVYSETLPNIYVDLTVDSFDGAFDIDGADQEYDLIAPWAECPDESVSRPNKHYLPDAVYNVTADIVALMNERFNVDRGVMQSYFDVLESEVKTNILFCEAILQYTGSYLESVNSFYSIYEKILYDKDRDENILEIDEEGNYYFKDKYVNIIRDNGISTDKEIGILSTILRFDRNLAVSSNAESPIIETEGTYKPGYMSRENMMLAAMSLIGKVKYVWGGGHGTTGAIQGINPSWQLFHDAYPDTEGADGYLNCIKPNNGWCPIHSTVNGGNGCLFTSKRVSNVDEYLTELSKAVDISSIDTDEYRALLEPVRFEYGLTAHRLDGLDCSGFASWIYNQVDPNHRYDSGAHYFISQNGIESLGVEGIDLYPGDVYSWGDHIVLIVGKSSDNSKAYVTIESTPSELTFGVAYYEDASSGDIADAINIAKQADYLLGGPKAHTRMGIYNMNKMGYSGADDKGYHDCGRLVDSFIDENTIISGFGKTMKEMNAVEIIQNAVNSLPISYISGLSDYSGDLFDVADHRETLANMAVEVIDTTDIS